MASKKTPATTPKVETPAPAATAVAAAAGAPTAPAVAAVKPAAAVAPAVGKKAAASHAAKPAVAAKAAAKAKPSAASKKRSPSPAPKADGGKAALKLVRDSFTIPKLEYAVLQQLKERAAQLKRPAKKSELLRAGITALQGMGDKAFLASLAAVPSLKTGRPKADEKSAAKPATKPAVK